jgi:hypothetical protein
VRVFLGGEFLEFFYLITGLLHVECYWK